MYCVSFCFLKKHISECLDEEITCTAESCEEKLDRRELTFHLLFDCLQRKITCEHCGEELIYINLMVYLMFYSAK